MEALEFSYNCYLYRHRLDDDEETDVFKKTQVYNRVIDELETISMLRDRTNEAIAFVRKDNEECAAYLEDVFYEFQRLGYDIRSAGRTF